MKKIILENYDKSKMKNLIVLSGRELGNNIRKRFKLDELDIDGNEYEVVFPESIISISTSFFLALFGESVRKCGSKEKFESKYLFNVNGSLKSNINDGIIDALNNVDGLSLWMI